MDPFFHFCQSTRNLKTTTKLYFKSDPAIQTACQKEAYPESFINLG
jgi:hypothetical protein